MSVIELDRVTIRLGGRSVLADASFAIERGEFIGVLGPNGAGKTTLMRAILGLIPPSAGSIRVFGRAPQRGDAGIGYLPQVRTVLPDLRVRGFDFIASSVRGERWGVPALARADCDMIGKTLAAIGARDLAERPLSEMSGGERQRLLLAQALLGEPRLLSRLYGTDIEVVRAGVHIFVLARGRDVERADHLHDHDHSHDHHHA